MGGLVGYQRAGSGQCSGSFCKTGTRISDTGKSPFSRSGKGCTFGKEDPVEILREAVASDKMSPIVWYPADGHVALGNVLARHLDAAFLADPVTEQEPPAHDLALFKGFPDTPFHILTDRPAFFLGVGCQDGQHEFAVGAFTVDVLLLKEYVYVQAFELSYRFQQGDGVPCEPGYGFRDDHIDLPGPAVRQHPLEFLPAVLGA